MNHFTVSGSWWEKNRLFPVSSASIRFISSSVRVKSNMSKFSFMRSS